tara:strand:+ start:190 stop:951 length:762 start_codon:yes stop_codon:yes gene_type:complete
MRKKLKALSTSGVNMFRADPARWWLAYVAGVRGGTNTNMARGLATEVGYDFMWQNEFSTEQEAIEAAIKKFNADTMFEGVGEKRDKEREHIAGFVEQTIEALKPYGFPTSDQTWHEAEMDGVPFKVTGRDDYCFKPHGDDLRPICLDLKTTHRVPSDMSAPHKRQMSLYQFFRPDHRIVICYVSTKKHAIYELDPDEAVEINKEFVIAAQAIERLLTTFDDPMDIAKLFAPDYSSFYWDDPIVRAEAKRIWGY